MTESQGGRAVPVPSKKRFRPSCRSLISSVPVGFLPTYKVSPGLMCCRREVTGPLGTLMLKNSSCSSQLALAME